MKVNPQTNKKKKIHNTLLKCFLKKDLGEEVGVSYKDIRNVHFLAQNHRMSWNIKMENLGPVYADQLKSSATRLDNKQFMNLAKILEFGEVLIIYCPYFSLSYIQYHWVDAGFVVIAFTFFFKHTLFS